MSNGIKGKAVILAGGSGGLGAAVAESLAEKGAIPIVGYLANRERAETLVSRLSTRYRINIQVIPGDILEAGVRQRLIEEAQRAGELYGLVPLVGNPARVPIETATEQDLMNSMRTNFIGPVLMARDFAAAAGQRDAAIVFLSTMQAIGVFPGSTTYAAPKAALIHTARILAKQWKIRVNVVAPGVNNAGMAEESVRSGKYDPFLEKKIRAIEDRSTNYWLLKYLERYKKDETLAAVVLDQKGTIELEDYYLRSKLSAAGKQQPGDTIAVRIESIDPAKSDVRFRVS